MITQCSLFPQPSPSQFLEKFPKMPLGLSLTWALFLSVCLLLTSLWLLRPSVEASFLVLCLWEHSINCFGEESLLAEVKSLVPDMT